MGSHQPPRQENGLAVGQRAPGSSAAAQWSAEQNWRGSAQSPSAAQSAPMAGGRVQKVPPPSRGEQERQLSQSAALWHGAPGALAPEGTPASGLPPQRPEKQARPAAQRSSGPHGLPGGTGGAQTPPQPPSPGERQ